METISLVKLFHMNTKLRWLTPFFQLVSLLKPCPDADATDTLSTQAGVSGAGKKKKATVVWAISVEAMTCELTLTRRRQAGQRRQADGWKGVKLPLTGLLIHSRSARLLRLPSGLWRSGTAGGVCVGSNWIRHHGGGWSRATAHHKVSDACLVLSIVAAQCLAGCRRPGFELSAGDAALFAGSWCWMNQDLLPELWGPECLHRESGGVWEESLQWQKPSEYSLLRVLHYQRTRFSLHLGKQQGNGAQPVHVHVVLWNFLQKNSNEKKDLPQTQKLFALEKNSKKLNKQPPAP